MNRKFSELNQFRIGLVGLIGSALIVAVSLNVGAIRDLLVSTNYNAEFSQSGGLRPGDSVRVSGLAVGKVKSVKLVDDHVEVRFAIDGVELGDRTRAAVQSENALGAKFLAIVPAGKGTIKEIPNDRTDESYDVINALGDLTASNAQLDVDQLARSMDSISATFANTAPELREALEGVGALSESISSRDAELRELLAHANGVTGVLSDRSREITKLLANGSALFEELDARRLVIRELLVNAQKAAQQLTGLVEDNEKQIAPVLKDLQAVIKVLNENQENIEAVLDGYPRYARSLGEAVGGGPFFYAFVENLVAPVDLVPILPELIRTEEGE